MGHMILTYRSHDPHMVLTHKSHDCYMVLTHKSHDCCMLHYHYTYSPPAPENVNYILITYSMGCEFIGLVHIIMFVLLFPWQVSVFNLRKHLFGIHLTPSSVSTPSSLS